MAHHKSAKKRIRSNLKKKLRNHAYISTVRSAIKSARESLGENDAKNTDGLLRRAQSLIAKEATKGILHQNTASRKISRLTQNAAKVQAAGKVQGTSNKKTGKKKASKSKLKKKKKK